MKLQEILKKSERLFDEYLDSVPCEEFLRLYDECETHEGPTVDEFLEWINEN